MCTGMTPGTPATAPAGPSAAEASAQASVLSTAPATYKTTMDVDPKDVSRGLVEPGNIKLVGRPLIDMPGGQVGSEYSVSFNQDGKEVLIPTIYDGKQHNPREAWGHYLKTGEHLGKYSNPTDADKAAEAIHNRENAVLEARRKKGGS